MQIMYFYYIRVVSVYDRWFTLENFYEYKDLFNIQSKSVNPDIVYPKNPPSDTLLPVTDLAPL